MKKSYFISRIFILIIAVIISLFMLINEHISVKIVMTTLIAVSSLVVSFVATPISKKMVSIGDKIEGKSLRIVYYVLLLPICLFVACILLVLIQAVSELVQFATNFSGALSEAMIFVFVSAIACVAIVVPYVQTLIVLFLKAIWTKASDGAEQKQL